MITDRPIRRAGGSLAALILFTALTSYADTPETATRFVPEVESQFARLALRPEGLAFRLGDAPEPNQCKHYQGMARLNTSGTPFIVVSWSGNRVSPNICFDGSDDPGALLLVQLGSRDTNGERLRSNRLRRDVTMTATVPVPEDRVVRSFRFDGASHNDNDWPAYGHPGGMQMVGDVLAVALEGPYDEGIPDNAIMFIDMSRPARPDIRSSYDVGTGSEFSAGLVGVAPVLREDGECCRYVMLVTGAENKELRLFRSLGGDLVDRDLDWELLEIYSESDLESCLGADWPSGAGQAHQMLNFVRQGAQTGPLYLIGGRNTTALPSGDDFIDLYQVGLDAQGNPGDCLLTHKRSTHVNSHPIIGGGDSANFAAASGVYVSPSGELIIYSTEYENDGPPVDGLLGRGTVRFGEWRHRGMVRLDSPTMRPGVRLDGPFSVDEGSTVTLTGAGEQAITKAWLQLFEDDGVGLSLPGFLNSDDWLAVDYQDWDKDDFDDFRKENFSDDAGSWRWFAPVGCTIRANDDDFGDSNFPGKFTRTLYGTGEVVTKLDLNQVPNDDGEYSMDDEITSMQFFPNCDAYYSAHISLNWDLDGDGDFEAHGDSVHFSAVELDGPAAVRVEARGQHPTDPTELGQGGAVPAVITVNNVAPAIGEARMVDAFGLELGADQPFAVLGLEYFLAASFTDPGRQDTQAAEIDWGDGSVESDADFEVFSDSFGGVTGEVRHGHAWTAPGSYQVELTVTDDDDGADATTISVEVLDATGLLAAAADEIRSRIASAPGAGSAALLERALAALHGEADALASSGAIDKLEGGQLNAMTVRLLAAISFLEEAEAAGAGDLSMLQASLATTARSVAYAQQAAALAGSVSDVRLTMMAAAIGSGDAAMGVSDYYGAVVAYGEAVRAYSQS